MKLKTLLLGSAAAMIAVSGARAADAVIAEPEAVEYVRVCDLYGSGFYYIPGTETCLNFNGYVRVDYTYRTDGVVNAAGQTGSSSRWDYRARFNIDARNETDYGTLRSQIRFQGDGNGGGDAVVGVDRALISLGGLRFGYSDSYTTTLHGYGNPVEKYDGYYGYDQAIFLDYTFAAGGFSVTAGIQDSAGGSDNAANPHANLDYYVGASYGGDYGSIAASYIYEDVADEGAWKVSATFTAVENLLIKGWYTGDENGRTYSVQGNGDYNWGVGASYQFMDTMAIRAGYTDADNPGSTLDVDYFTVGLNWTPVSGLAVRPEVQIYSDDDLGQEYSLRVYRTF